MSYTPNNVNGQATKANSSPVVVASDQSVGLDVGASADAAATTDTGTFSLIALVKRMMSNGVRLWNGTNIVDITAGDSGNNALVVAGGRKDSGSQALSTSNYPAANGIDCSNYAWVSVHVQAYTSGTITFQGSNDNATWVSVALFNAGSATGTISTTATAIGIFHGPLAFRYFRVTGGIATIFVEFFTTPRTGGATTPSSATYAVNASGTKTNNNAAPGATNIGALTGLANAAAPTDTEGDLVLLSTDLAGNLRVAPTPYPAAATPLTATSGDVANTAAVATLAGAASKTTYITGFSLFPGGATAMGVVVATVTGLISGTLSVLVAATAIATAVNGSPIIVNFPYPIPASAANTAIVVTMPALGTGNLHAVANAQGFQL